MRGAFAVILLLAGCAPASGPGPVLRDARVTLASKADFDPATLSGRWHEVARLPDGGCAGGVVDYVARPGAGVALAETCGGRVVTGRADPSGPGRLRVVRSGQAVEEWVLWMDADARTTVIARADGRSARILDRTPGSSPDRMRAAETVLDFNGFDSASLVQPAR